MNAYLYLTKKGKHQFLAVNLYEKGRGHFPLTKDGCREAGRFLYRKGMESWLCSSDVDFAEEVGFDEDVRQLVNEGWSELSKKEEAHRWSLLDKIFAHCDSKEFQKQLTVAERKAYREFKQHAETERANSN